MNRDKIIIKNAHTNNLKHIDDNGLTQLPEIPVATTQTHVTTEFEGLPEEYPVLFGSFVGGHTENVKDPGSEVNWIAKETWDFFMRFYYLVSLFGQKYSLPSNYWKPADNIPDVKTKRVLLHILDVPG